VGRRLREALRWGRDQLSGTPTDTPELDAQVLLAHVCGTTRASALAWPERLLSVHEAKMFRGAVERRARGEPVAYITGLKEFFGLNLAVDGRVLIPRPETELMVERALEYVPEDGDGRVVADVGTGSGAIALALASARLSAQVIATDTSSDAIGVASENARRLLGAEWEARITFVHGAVLAGLSGPMHVVCANLPYIPTGELATLPVSVRAYEPWSALDGGPDGLNATASCSGRWVERLRRTELC